MRFLCKLSYGNPANQRRQREAKQIVPAQLYRSSLDSANIGLEASDTDRETIHARYAVGCDGGHSTVRQHLEMKLEGEKTNKHFGVMDIVPLTDFRMSNLNH